MDAKTLNEIIMNMEDKSTLEDYNSYEYELLYDYVCDKISNDFTPVNNLSHKNVTCDIIVMRVAKRISRKFESAELAYKKATEIYDEEYFEENKLDKRILKNKNNLYDEESEEYLMLEEYVHNTFPDSTKKYRSCIASLSSSLLLDDKYDDVGESIEAASKYFNRIIKECNLGIMINRRKLQ